MIEDGRPSTPDRPRALCPFSFPLIVLHPYAVHPYPLDSTLPLKITAAAFVPRTPEDSTQPGAMPSPTLYPRMLSFHPR